VVFIDTLLSGALIALPRLMVRVTRGSLRRRRYESGKRVLIAGAGDAGKLRGEGVVRNVAARARAHRLCRQRRREARTHARRAPRLWPACPYP
jgi:FlaA1/EpsC-like NDP-sugar epimerase